MQQDITFTMEIDGAPCQCTVLFTFYSDITKAHYMLYTPDDPAGPAQVRLIAARYQPEDLSKLESLRDDTDRAIVQSFIEYVSSHSAERLRATAGRSRRKTTVFVILQTCERAGAGHYAIYK